MVLARGRGGSLLAFAAMSSVVSPIHLALAVRSLRAGGVIAYPTEAVWGLGCDPWQRPAFERLLALKGRDPGKGVILIAASIDQVRPWLGRVPAERLPELLAGWPGPLTWVVLVGDEAPAWVRGRHASVAIRVSAHPVVQALCHAFGGPLVSTSANRSDRPPARDRARLRAEFGNALDYVLPGALGGLDRPTPIRDALSGAWLRR